MAEMQTRRQYNDEIPEAKLVENDGAASSHAPPKAEPYIPPPSYEQGMAQLCAEQQGQYVAQCNKLVRLGFLRKVYGILTMQLFATGLICAIAMRAEGPVVNNFHTLSIGSTLVGSRALYWCIFVLSLVLLFVLFCYKQRYPINMFLLSLWTISLALSVATSTTIAVCDPLVTSGALTTRPFSLVPPGTKGLQYYDGRIVCALGTGASDNGTNAVIMAGFLTMALFGALTVFTFQSKWDFSFLGAGLGVALLLLIMWGVIMAIFGLHNSYLFALAGTVIFSLYILYDTWRLLNVYGPDDVVLACIDLYLDIINLFLMILSLLRSDR